MTGPPPYPTPSPTPQPAPWQDPAGSAAADYMQATAWQAAPAVQYRAPTRLRIALAAITVVVTLLVGVSAYTIAGFAIATNQIAGADRALSATINHHDDLNAAFNALGTQLQSIGGAGFDPVQARRLMAQFVEKSQSAGITVEGDDAALASADGMLNDHQWLTVLSRGRLDHEAGRISHARKALTEARILTSDYVLVGQFFQAYVEVVVDYLTLIQSFQRQDFAGAGTADTALRDHLEQALKLDGAPGLPSIIHDFLVDFRVLAVDLAKIIDAARVGDKAAFDAALVTVKADNAKLDVYDFSQASSQLKAYYQPFRDKFDAEMARAAD